MSSRLTSKTKYFNSHMSKKKNNLVQDVLVWCALSTMLQEVIKLLEDEDVPACLPRTSAGLNVKLGAGTVSRRSAHYIMTELPSGKLVTGAVSKDWR